MNVRARIITKSMKLAAAKAIAEIISDNELHAEYVIPSVFDRRVCAAVADAVSHNAIESGLARKESIPGAGA